MDEKSPVDTAYDKIMRYMGWERKKDPATQQEIRDVLSGLWDKGREVTGKDLAADAGEDETCGCGWAITEYGGDWLHVYNPELTGSGDHDAEPG